MAKKVMNLHVRNEAAPKDLPDVELWLEREPRGSIMLKAKHSESTRWWNVIEIHDDFTFQRYSGLSGNFPSSEIKERD